jgi:hypothetical protein
MATKKPTESGIRADTFQTNFTAGEFSPLLEGRVELAKYKDAVSKLENFYCFPHGPIDKRPGTRFISAVKTEANKTRLIPFIFSTIQAYVLEFGNNYIRFYKDEGQITSGGPAYEISTTYTTAQIPDLRFTQSADILYICHSAHAPKELSRTGHTAWILTDYDYGDGPYLDENTTATTIAPSATTGNITLTASTTLFSSNDIGRNVRIKQGSAWGSSKITAFTGVVSSITIAGGGSGYGSSPPTITISGGGGSGATATAVLTAGAVSSITITAGGSEYSSIGTIVFSDPPSGTTATGSMVITTTTSATVIVDSDSDYVDTSAVTTWRLGSWYVNNWPSGQPTFFNNRLVFCNTTAEPNAFWCSRSNDFNSHKPTIRDGTVVDSSAVNRLITDNQVNAIYWLVVDNADMFAGTSDGPFKIWSGSTTEVFSPTKVKVDKQTRDGATNISPSPAGDSILYVSRSTLKIRELSFSFEKDKHLSANLSLLAEHITKPGIAHVEYISEPDSIVYCILTDGSLISMTYKRDENVIAWHKQILGGTGVEVESLAAIPGIGGTFDTLYMIVKRTINGATHRYVEFLEERFEPTTLTDKNDAFFVDSGLSYSGVAANTITGLSHLEGEVVTIMSEGATHANKTVSSGQITLDRTTTRCHVGLGYTSKLVTLPLDAAMATGTSQGKTKRISEVLLRLYKSLGGQIGPSETNLERILTRSGLNPMDSSPPLETGDRILNFNGPHERQAKVTVIHDEPLPFTLVAIGPRAEIQKR